MRYLSINTVLLVLMSNDHVGVSGMEPFADGVDASVLRSAAADTSVGGNGGEESGERPLTGSPKPAAAVTSVGGGGGEESVGSADAAFGDRDVKISATPAGTRALKLRLEARKSGESVRIHEVAGVIDKYNKLLQLTTDDHSGLLGVKDPYFLTLYTVLCEISTDQSFYAPNAKCQPIVGEVLKKKAMHDLRNLIELAHPEETKALKQKAGNVVGRFMLKNRARRNLGKISDYVSANREIPEIIAKLERGETFTTPEDKSAAWRKCLPNSLDSEAISDLKKQCRDLLHPKSSRLDSHLIKPEDSDLIKPEDSDLIKPEDWKAIQNIVRGPKVTIEKIMNKKGKNDDKIAELERILEDFRSQAAALAAAKTDPGNVWQNASIYLRGYVTRLLKYQALIDQSVSESDVEYSLSECSHDGRDEPFIRELKNRCRLAMQKRLDVFARKNGKGSDIEKVFPQIERILRGRKSAADKALEIGNLLEPYQHNDSNGGQIASLRQVMMPLLEVQRIIDNAKSTSLEDIDGLMQRCARVASDESIHAELKKRCTAVLRQRKAELTRQSHAATHAATHAARSPSALTVAEGSTLSEFKPYEVLGVAPGASAEDITAAYRRAALAYHTDRFNGPRDIFQRINEAHGILKNPDLRAAYDRNGMSGVTGLVLTDGGNSDSRISVWGGDARSAGRSVSASLRPFEDGAGPIPGGGDDGSDESVATGSASSRSSSPRSPSGSSSISPPTSPRSPTGLDPAAVVGGSALSPRVSAAVSSGLGGDVGGDDRGSRSLGGSTTAAATTIQRLGRGFLARRRVAASRNPTGPSGVSTAPTSPAASPAGGVVDEEVEGGSVATSGASPEVVVVPAVDQAAMDALRQQITGLRDQVSGEISPGAFGNLAVQVRGIVLPPGADDLEQSLRELNAAVDAKQREVITLIEDGLGRVGTMTVTQMNSRLVQLSGAPNPVAAIQAVRDQIKRAIVARMTSMLNDIERNARHANIDDVEGYLREAREFNVPATEPGLQKAKSDAIEAALTRVDGLKFPKFVNEVPQRATGGTAGVFFYSRGGEKSVDTVKKRLFSNTGDSLATVRWNDATPPKIHDVRDAISLCYSRPSFQITSGNKTILRILLRIAASSESMAPVPATTDETCALLRRIGMDDQVDACPAAAPAAAAGGASARGGRRSTSGSARGDGR